MCRLCLVCRRRYVSLRVVRLNHLLREGRIDRGSRAQLRVRFPLYSRSFAARIKLPKAGPPTLHLTFGLPLSSWNCRYW